jgi:hypothetical protein
MVPAHRTVLWRAAALVLLAAFIIAVVIGCRTGSTSTPPSSSTPATFSFRAVFSGGSGHTETAHFITYGDWGFYWSCDPGTDDGSGDYVPFSLVIRVMTGGQSPVVAPVVATTCENPSDSHSAGTVEVHQSGEQWLDVVAGVVASGAGGTWSVNVSVPQSDIGAELVSTSLCRLPCRSGGALRAQQEPLAVSIQPGAFSYPVASESCRLFVSPPGSEPDATAERDTTTL